MHYPRLQAGRQAKRRRKIDVAHQPLGDPTGTSLTGLLDDQRHFDQRIVHRHIGTFPAEAMVFHLAFPNTRSAKSR